jgi:hypothetical protein
VSPEQPGAFNINFAPDTLEAFKNLSRIQGKQYTTVLEQLVEAYLKTNGKLLEDMPPAPSATSKPVPASSSINTRGDTVAELLERMERVEADDREFVSAFEMLLHRVEALEGQVTYKDIEKRLEHLEKAVQYKNEKSKN